VSAACSPSSLLHFTSCLLLVSVSEKGRSRYSCLANSLSVPPACKNLFNYMHRTDHSGNCLTHSRLCRKNKLLTTCSIKLLLKCCDQPQTLAFLLSTQVDQMSQTPDLDTNFCVFIQFLKKTPDWPTRLVRRLLFQPSEVNLAILKPVCVSLLSLLGNGSRTNKYTCNNGRTVGRVVFCAVLVAWRKNRRLGVTFLLYTHTNTHVPWI
jgi:hypothetical protein